MKEKNIKVLIVEPEYNPYMAIIPNELKVFQEIVGGYIEVPHYFEDVDTICNDEGKINGMEHHRHIIVDGEWIDIIAGTFIVVGNNEAGNFASLTDAQIRKYMLMFMFPYSYRKDTICGRSVIDYKINSAKPWPATFEKYRIEYNLI